VAQILTDFIGDDRKLERLFRAEERKACAFPVKLAKQRLPAKVGKNLRRDGDSGMQHSPVGGFKLFSDGITTAKAPAMKSLKPGSAWENHFLPRFGGTFGSNALAGMGITGLLTLDFAFIDWLFPAC